MREMTTQVHFVLCAVAQLAVQSETPAKTQHVYETYTALAEELDANVLSERRVRDHLSELSMQGVLNVNERNTGIHGGSYYEYEISVDLAAVLDVLLDIDRLEGAAETRWSSRRSAATSSIPNPLILSGSDGLSTGLRKHRCVAVFIT